MALPPNSRRTLLIGGAAFLGTAMLGIGALLSRWSPGDPAPLVDVAGQPRPGSISERVYVMINGTRQGLIIQSTDAAHPVLLFLHSGPGMPEFFLNTTHPSGLEQDFTVVWWEQRGAGLSFSPDIPPESMTVTQFIADTLGVTQYLRRRFGKDRIILLGHSWGSFLGIQVAAAAPDLFHAYVGMGQVSFQLRSEVAAHPAMLAQYRMRGDTAMVRKLEAAPVSMADGLSPAYLRLRDQAMHGLGCGATRDIASVVTGVFLPVWQCPAYTISEKVDIWRGLSFSRGFLWDTFLRTDLTRQIKALDLPVYFLSGAHDLTANYGLSREFFDQIKAPVKGFYTFRNSAHSPLIEEPGLGRNFLTRDVLSQETRLSDEPAMR